jgi:WD40 repeat protein
VLVDSQPTVLDGPLVVVDAHPLGTDVQVVNTDVQALDLAAPADAKVEVLIPTQDAGVDVTTPDLPVGPDLGPDSAVDVPPTTTTMNILANCTAYTHTQKDSTGVIEDWAVYQVAFTPDGKTLISFGEDGRAKVWNVTVTGLAAPANGLEFASTNYGLNGAISPDGKYVAVSDKFSEVTVYDLPTSMQYGAPSVKWSLPVGALSVSTGYVDVVQFTSDGAHLVTAYKAYSSPDPNQFVVWELGTQTIARHLDYAYNDRPLAVFPGSYTGAMWVASAARISGDAGGYVSTVTLMDVSQASPTKAQFTVPGYVNNMAFSPDGTTLALAFDSGEVSLWDITNKSNMTRLGSPLVAASTSSTISAYALGYTNDGKYLAAGIGDSWGSANKLSLVQLQQKTALQKTLNFYPWAAVFSPDGLGLAVGESNQGVLLYCRP